MSCNEKWNISYYIALFAGYFYAKDYSNSTMMAGFYDEFIEKIEESNSSKKAN